MITKTFFSALFAILLTLSAVSQESKQVKGQISISDEELKTFISIMDELTDQEKVKQNIEEAGEEILIIIQENPHIDRNIYFGRNQSGIKSQLTEIEKQALEEVTQQIMDLVIDRIIDKYPMTKLRFEEIKYKVLELKELQNRYKSLIETDK